MSSSIQRVIDKKNCSGCFLCMNICPRKCIEIKLNKEGFYYPQIDKERCNNCGICLEKCPINNQFNKNEYDESHVYMAKSLDEDLKIKSSSGGVFGEIAKYIISKEGIVYGAIFNKKNEVIHIGIEDEKDLDQLIGSKYLQSNLAFTYKNIKANLLGGKLVLFVGLPCQINALRNFVGDHKNLVLIDLVCHGVPSQKIFKKYLQNIFGNEEIKEIYFRDKQDNREWENFKIKIIGELSTYLDSHRKDAFFYGYLKNLYLNDMCYACVFSHMPRVSDITLGDYWGVAEKLKDKEGTSLVVVSSIKGEELLHQLYSNKKIHLIETSMEDGSKRNPRLLSGKLSVPKEREEILRNIDKLSFEEIDNLFIKSFNNEVYRNFIDTIKNKKVIIFGTGSVLSKILSNKKHIKLEDIKYLLDNDPKKQSSIIYNKTVYGIEQLGQENIEDIFVVIASSYYEEISSQLKAFGLKEDINFIDGIKYLLYE